MNIALIVLYIIVILVHLFACYTKSHKLRLLTKPLLLLLLAVIYCVLSHSFSIFILLSLIFGLVGDVFLMFPKRKKWLICGMSSFALGHICYIVQFTLDGPAALAPLWFKIASICVYAAVIAVSYTVLKVYIPKDIKRYSLPYMILIAAMSLCALLCFAGSLTFPYALAALGSLFFVMSDSILSFEIFKGETKRGNFWVMLTYITAQTLITACYIMR